MTLGVLGCHYGPDVVVTGRKIASSPNGIILQIYCFETLMCVAKKPPPTFDLSLHGGNSIRNNLVFLPRRLPPLAVNLH